MFIYSANKTKQNLVFSDPFINRRRANGFMQTDMRLEAIAQERYVVTSGY